MRYGERYLAIRLLLGRRIMMARAFVAFLVLWTLPVLAQGIKHEDNRKDYGKLWLESDPSGAKVSYMQMKGYGADYDSKAVLGTTPCMILLTQNKHLIHIEKNGYAVGAMVHTIKDTTIVKKKVKLDLLENKVDIFFDKSGWKVYLNNKPHMDNGKIAEAPISINLPGGRYKLQLKKDGKVITKIITNRDDIVDLSKEEAVVDKNPPKESIVIGEIATEDEWNKIRGLMFTVKATNTLDTRLVFDGTKKYRLIPHPTDKWTNNRNLENSWLTHKGGKEIAPNGIAVGALSYKLNKDGDISNNYEIAGKGRLYLLANDTIHSDNNGTVRVKIVMLE